MSKPGFFNFPDFLPTQLKFPVKQREFPRRIVLVIAFSVDIVSISMHLLEYFKLPILWPCISWIKFGQSSVELIIRFFIPYFLSGCSNFLHKICVRVRGLKGLFLAIRFIPSSLKQAQLCAEGCEGGHILRIGTYIHL